tara:strand:+ start:547 stop:789 length:243 start_codon:yes stop_codon:yes gene_type:complete
LGLAFASYLGLPFIIIASFAPLGPYHPFPYHLLVTVPLLHHPFIIGLELEIQLEVIVLQLVLNLDFLHPLQVVVDHSYLF